MTIQNVIEDDLCLGCGLCEALAKKKCKMILSDKGFYIPSFTKPLNKEEDKYLTDICPAINLKSKHSKGVWGDNIRLYGESWSNDEEIRFKGSSGGLITGLANSMLKSNKIDAVLHVGPSSNHWLYNELKESVNREDLIANSGSRYAPAKVFNDIIPYLEASQKKYLFIGKPCDVYALQNLISINPHFKDKIVLKIAIFCAGMPSYDSTKKLNATNRTPISVRYRGNGWPGKFKISFNNHSPIELSYQESWGNTLGKSIHFRCKICPDGIGLTADISIGDSWESKNGYPDFENKPGKSLVIVRTDIAVQYFTEAIQNRDITFIDKKNEIETLRLNQKYQYERRLYAIYRLIPVFFLKKSPLRFKGFNFYRMISSGRIKRGLGNLYGTFKRL